MSYVKSVCLVLMLPAVLYGSTVVINEFVASNSRSAADPQNQYDDWIELYNASGAAIDVGGMHLTDDLGEPDKWRLPLGVPAVTTIPPRGYLVIWADGDIQDAGLHANFKLSASGEELGLFDIDGTTLLDSVTFGAQTSDISFGRYPDGADDWRFGTFPSPGSSNSRMFEDVVAPVTFSPERGFYDVPVYVTLACDTPDVVIYYTTDGREPYDPSGRGPTGSLYTGPILVYKTTCLRACAVKSGWMSSGIQTHTYLLVPDITRQSPQGQPPGSMWPSGSVNGQILDYGMDPDVVDNARYADLIDDALLSIPSISLVTNLANLFDSQQGIYVNAGGQGLNWERPVSVELIDPNGADGFQIDAGLRIRGGYSRSGGNPKHAFRLFFRPDYGPSTLQFTLFGDEGAGEFECVDLRTSQNYSWSFEGGNSNSHDTFVREVFSRDTQRDMGQPYTRSRYYHLYINGHYWGLYQTQERSEASYAESYFGGSKEGYDVIKSRAGNGGYDIEATDGTLDAWRRLWDAARAGFGSDESYYRVQGLNPDRTPNDDYERLLDVDNLIDYMLCTYYVGDPDGPVSAWALVANNFYGIYDRTHPDGFKFFRHDAEHSLYDLYESRLFAPTTMAVGSQFRQSNPLWLHLQLMAHPEYRTRFADRVYKHFFNDGVLTPQPCAERFAARADQIDLAIVAESARWGDAKRSVPRTRDNDWRPDMDRMMTNYFPNRTDVVLSQFKSQGWYPPFDPPVFYINGAYQPGGHVAVGDQLSMPGNVGAVWCTLDGSDPRTPGVAGGPSSGLTLVAEAAAKRVLVPVGTVDDAWRGGASFDDSTWTAGAGGVGYERSTGYEQFFHIDVQNQMYGRNASCYIRIPFELSAQAASELASLTLKVRYDDGFVAYLNGVEVQRVAFSGMPTWNSSAAMSHSDIDAMAQETFDISGYVGQLHAGQNVLAIHGLNESTTSSDFLISAELTATRSAGGGKPSGVSPTAQRYTSPVTLTASTHVKARVLSGSTWSALNEMTFAVGPVAEYLRISELMYHPLETGHPDDPNAEYIELTNVGTETINLNLVKFTDGVDFTFSDIDLAPDAYVVVVRDVAAFEARYGASAVVAGQYSGSLSNAGERLELRDAAGQVVHNFAFQDGWYDLTDGLGFSLTVKAPGTTDPMAYGDSSVWRPSADAAGSPGYDDTAIGDALGAMN
ncbi:MAG: lamin tail domain-containing protein [Sedimentisphaerales bacterium]|nr:lamin tail domain-containing protein [Sedimentisphaerales bacterium]